MRHFFKLAMLGTTLIVFSALAGCGGASTPQSEQPGPQPAVTGGMPHAPAPQAGLQMPTAQPMDIDFDSSDDKSTSAIYRILFRDSVNEQSGGRWTPQSISGAKQWTLSNTCFSAPKAWVIGQNYWNREYDQLSSNLFPVADGEAGLAITFYARYDIAPGDNGTVWYFDGFIMNQVVNFTAGTNPSYPGWDKYYYKLPVNVFGPVNCGVAATFQSDTSVTGWGFGLDNVAVYQTQLGAPIGLVATDGTSVGQVYLDWDHVQVGALLPDGYDIYRADDDNGAPGAYGLLASTVHPTSFYSDPTGNANQYWYKVVATKAGWPDSPDSNVDNGHGDGTWSNLTADDIGDVGSFTSIVQANGRPGIAHFDNDTGDLLWSWSNMPDGSSSWNEQVVDGAVNWVGEHFNGLRLANGVPAISYYDGSTTFLKYAYSANAQGDAGWTVVDVNTAGFTGMYSSLAIINGFPAISYSDQFNDALGYAYSNTVDGSAGWNNLIVDGSEEIGNPTALAEINGFPAIAHFHGNAGDLVYSYSTQPDGSSGWTTVIVDSVGTVGISPSLALVDGKPAISYWDSTNADLKYAYSSLADGSGGWTSVTVDSPASNAGEGTSLAVVYGRPAIAYWDWDDLRYASSTAPDGSAGWTSVAVDTVGLVGGHPGLATMAGGAPAISYHDSTNTNLKYAYFH